MYVRTESAPQFLKDNGCFCNWKYEQRGGRQTKAPYISGTTRRASVGDLPAFTDFEAAATATGFDGIGICACGRIVGIDLDHCIEDGYDRAIRKESLFRNIATVVRAYGGSERIFAKDCEDLAAWAPEGDAIPLANGMEDFTKHAVDSHKLAALVKLDNDFIRDAAFDFEDYLTGRMSNCFVRAEDSGFLTGNGKDQPTGLLHLEKGAETGATTAVLTYNDVIKLYFSVKPEYRRNGARFMNDETALTLRTVKDGNGNYLWHHSDNTILGRPVEICEYMPSAENSKAPVLFGDFRYYWIALRSPVTVKRITELYVRYDQIGYLAIEFLDGKLIRKEAVKALRITA